MLVNKLDINSQEKLDQINTYLFHIEEIYDYMNTSIPNFNEKIY